MSETKARGRPKDPQAKAHAVMVRLDDAELAGLNALVEARNEELRVEGVKVKAPDVLRWLVARELAARGLQPSDPSAKGGKAPRKPARSGGPS